MERKEQCQRCGGPRGKSTHDKLCAKCVKSLPQCKSCGIVCGAPEWDFLEEKKSTLFVFKENGMKIILCGGCEGELEIKGFLRIEGKGKGNEKILLRDELVKK